MRIRNIWFEFEEWDSGYDENTDVHFELDDGTRWCAQFFTYRNLLSLSEENRNTGECLCGSYFYAHKPIFISKINKEMITSVIEDIIRCEADLSAVFTKADEQ